MTAAEVLALLQTALEATKGITDVIQRHAAQNALLQLAVQAHQAAIDKQGPAVDPPKGVS